MPFNEVKINSNEKIRTFKHDVLDHELVWHRDKNDRLVEVLFGEGWLFQLEGCLPVEMVRGDVYSIPACTFHRIKRGHTDLVIRIQENGSNDSQISF